MINSIHPTYIARKKNFRGSPQKLRLTANLIRGMSIEEAHDVLEYSVTKPSKILSKLLSSAISNAEAKSADIDNLSILSIKVDKAMVLKRFKASGRGRIRGISHRYSHIELILEDRSQKLSETKPSKKSTTKAAKANKEVSDTKDNKDEAATKEVAQESSTKENK